VAGLPRYSSAQASCSIDAELAGTPLDDSESLVATMRRLYGTCGAAVDEELGRIEAEARRAEPPPERPVRRTGYTERLELLRESTAARHAACERERLLVRKRLTAALSQLLPRGSRVWVYGSLVEAGRFREWSDVDLALERDPPGMSIYLMASLLAERCGRRVDLCLIDETRLADTILRRGEPWTV
jgi:predicted nucleotidyltransferase